MMQETIFSTVLLIEDNESHSMLIKRALRPYVATTTHFVDVQSALEYLAGGQRPELIITDLNLPDTTGVRHVQRLREASAELPIIVLTSSTLLSDAVAAMQLGARDYLVKSFDGDFQEALGLALSRMRTALEIEAEKLRLQREMATLQLAIENSRDGLAVVDSTGLVRYSNTSFRNFIESCAGQEHDLLSFDLGSIQKGELLGQKIRTQLLELEPGASWSTEIILTEDGARAFDLNLSAVGKGATDPVPQRDLVVWLKDISEQKRREKFQRDMLSTTTHDLKGPLGAVITGGELLQELLEVSQKPYQIALRMTSAARGVVNLIDEFLSAHRLQEGNFILKPGEFTLAELFEEPQANFETIARARGINLSFQLSDQEKIVCIDKLGFGRVLGNLLSNAIKFTPKQGSVMVSARVDQEFHVCVSDTGSGMEAAEVQRMFERFSRLKKHEHSVEGTGIGLFVVRCIVEAHAGSVQVTSTPGQGTSFELSFPLAPPVNERGELICLDFG